MTAIAAVSERRLAVDRCDPHDARWQAYVARHRESLPFHNAAWADALRSTYGFEVFTAVARDGDGAIAAGVPIAEVRRPFGARRWVALPFTDYCPPLADDRAAEAALLEGVDALRQEREIAAFELRSDAAHIPVDVGVRHVLRLERDPDAVFGKFKKTQVRQRITKAEREGVVSTRISEERSDVMETFFRLHVATRRRLGVPVQPKRFFEAVWEQMIASGRGFAVVAEADGSAVAAAIFLVGRSAVVYKYSASDVKAWSLRPNNLVLWTAIRHAAESGFESFDFGRTEHGNEGLRSFKAGWGTEELPLRYSLIGGEAPTAASAGRLGRAAAAVIRRSPPIVCRTAGLLYRWAA